MRAGPAPRPRSASRCKLANSSSAAARGFGIRRTGNLLPVRRIPIATPAQPEACSPPLLLMGPWGLHPRNVVSRKPVADRLAHGSVAKWQTKGAPAPRRTLEEETHIGPPLSAAADV